MEAEVVYKTYLHASFQKESYFERSDSLRHFLLM